MLRRKLACSFCRKSETDVAKLVAGPGVYICDQCAAQVIRIMEDSTNDEARPSSSPSGLLRRMRARIHWTWHQRGRRSTEHHAVARVAPAV